MNTRNAIQPSDQPAVLSIAFSQTRKRFIVGLDESCRILRTDNCLTRHYPRLNTSQRAFADGGVGVASIFDDRYFAFVKGGRTPQGSIHKFVFWNAVLNKQVCELDLHEPIIGLRLGTSFTAIILKERTVLFQYQKLLSLERPQSEAQSLEEDEVGPNELHSLIRTSTNDFGLCQVLNNTIVLPAQSTGQVQIIPLPAGSKRVFRAHNTAIRALALSDDGSLIATASVQGTLVRVFDTTTLDQIAEFRRGVDNATIYSLAISPGNRWVACTSDKGTLHIFDLRPGVPSSLEMQRSTLPHGKPIPQAPSAVPPSIASVARSSPPASVQYQGSVQEYYGLIPPPTTTSPTSTTAATSALNAFKQSAFAPRALKDVRSVASAPFYTGIEAQHWQGGAAYSWTTGPDGTARKVRNPVPPLADDPSGRPPKGILAFASEEMDDNTGALLYVIGGGSDARWERFRLARGHSGSKEWILGNEGFRRYLTRQFTD